MGTDALKRRIVNLEKLRGNRRKKFVWLDEHQSESEALSGVEIGPREEPVFIGWLDAHSVSEDPLYAHSEDEEDGRSNNEPETHDSQPGSAAGG